jgi:hypothetical protein|tara:strand:+ start:297 stop:461 length:165 start_codon:yes stop_codon:yes gene_type:complete
MVLKELEKIIFELDEEILKLEKNDIVPKIITEGLLDAKGHLIKALEILNEGGDY